MPEPPEQVGLQLDGFTFRTAAPVQLETGGGLLFGPDGSAAGIQWELADSAFIMRVEPPNQSSWGVYRVGFTRRMKGRADLAANLQELLPKLRIIYQRIRVQ